MKIVIEVSPQLEGKRGIGVYTENLIKGLAKIDKENEYILFSWFFKNYEEKIKMLYCPEQENFSLFIKKFPDSLVNKLEWRFKIPIIYNFLKSKNIDIYHSTGLRLPNLRNVKRVITAHDLAYKIYPEWVQDNLNLASKSIKQADKIIVNSENTKRDILRFYNIPEKKIAVINPGFDRTTFRPLYDMNFLSSIKNKYFLPDKFILSVGPFNPHKNHKNVIRTYHLLFRSKKLYHKLVLVGRKSFEYRNLMFLVKELGLTQQVIFTDYIPTEELVGVYNLASVLVFLSLNEGFGGYPLLEAMSSGTPVIASNVSSIPEAVKEGGILVDPYNIEEIGQAIHSVLINSQLREKLRQKGLERMEGFSCEKTAKEVLKVYEGLV